ncbi:MAG: YitT family protein [Candidatus Microsaccharimonas sp.]
MELPRIYRIPLIIIGSVLAAVGLQLFLLPNHLLDGGVTGISIISAYLSGIPFGVFLLLFNIPFIYLGWKKFGKDFALCSSIGIATLAALTFIHLPHGFTDQPILAAVFGGIFVGVGAGLVIRYGGVIDGSDTIAVLIDRVTVFSVGEAIMVINGIIITIAGFVFGWENALYSLIAYFVAHKAIDVTVEGLNESRSVWVVSMKVRDIGHIINQVINEPVTYLKEANKKDAEPHGILLAVITRFEEQKIKAAIHSVDKQAFVVISNAHEIMRNETSRSTLPS